MGPESCVDARKGIGEALTGEDAGRAIEPLKKHRSEGRQREQSGRQHVTGRNRKNCHASEWSKTPATHLKSPIREPGDPWHG